MKAWLLLFIFISHSCNHFGSKRYPAGDRQKVFPKTPQVSFMVNFKHVQKGLDLIAKTSPMIEKVNHFDMDPVTRIFSLGMTLRFPMDNILNFENKPEVLEQGELHDLEVSFRFGRTKDIALRNYLGLQITKFTIDNSDYTNQFEIILASLKTLLANSNLIDYVLLKNSKLAKDESKINLVKEIFNSKAIIVSATNKKILFNLNLARFEKAAPYVKEVKNLKLWRFSPMVYHTDSNEEGIAIKVVIGEGKPHNDWIENELSLIDDDTRSLLQAREDLYQRFSDSNELIKNAKSNAINFLKEYFQKVKVKKIQDKYQEEINHTLSLLQNQAAKVLNINNEHFKASPEDEYIHFSKYVDAKIRYKTSEIKRKILLDELILQGGIKDTKSPLMTKLVSENLLSGAMNFVLDTKVGKHQLFKQAYINLKPKKSYVILGGELNLPINFILGKINQDFSEDQYKSHLDFTKNGLRFELILYTKMGDNGNLMLDIQQLTLFPDGISRKRMVINKEDKNQKFLIDLTKVFLAQSLASINIDMSEEANPEQREQAEIKEILSYLEKIKLTYRDQKDLENILVSDLILNPMNASGEKHILRKKEIILGDLIKFNNLTEMFEIKLDPDIAFDKIQGVEHNLQLWGLEPVRSENLNNNFLKMTVGHGIRTNDFIVKSYAKNGALDNDSQDQLYYQLGDKRSSADILMTLHFSVIEDYINQFLAKVIAKNNIDLKAQAKASPGTAFYQPMHMHFSISGDNKLHLEIDIEKAELVRHWYSFWKQSLELDSYSIKGEIQLTQKDIELNNDNLTNLSYHKSALKIKPLSFRITKGNPSLVNRAILGIINKAGNMAFGDGLVNSLVLKIFNRFLNGMYNHKDGLLIGHELEKLARIKVVGKDLVLLLNPKAAGGAFNIHFVSSQDSNSSPLKLDRDKQQAHIAFTSGVAMAKMDKKELIQIYQEVKILSKTISNNMTKVELEDLLKGQDFAHKLISETSKNKQGYYQRLRKIISKYDHILHTTDFASDQVKEEALRQRASATGSELIYVAAISHELIKTVIKAKSMMKKHDIYNKNNGSEIFDSALLNLEKNIILPLVTRYKTDFQKRNQTIMASSPSYWTYQVYPDAHFAETTFQKMAQDSAGVLINSSKD